MQKTLKNLLLCSSILGAFAFTSTTYADTDDITTEVKQEVVSNTGQQEVVSDTSIPINSSSLENQTQEVTEILPASDPSPTTSELPDELNLATNQLLTNVQAENSQPISPDVSLAAESLANTVKDKIQKIPLETHTADKVFSIDSSTQLNEDERTIYDELKKTYDSYPEFVRKITNKVIVTRSDKPSFGWTLSRSAIVTLNTKYWNKEDTLDHEKAVMAHEIGHAVDGRSLISGKFDVASDSTVDKDWKSFSRDKTVRDLLRSRYKGAIYYEAWASVFGEYLAILSGDKKIESDIDKRIKNYGDKLFEHLLTEKEKGFKKKKMTGSSVSYDLEALEIGISGTSTSYELPTLEYGKPGDSTSYELPTLEYGRPGDSTSYKLETLKYGTSGTSTSYDLPISKYGTSNEPLSYDLEKIGSFDLPASEYGASGTPLTYELPILEYGKSGDSTSYELLELNYGASGKSTSYDLPELKLGISGNPASHNLPVLEYGTSGDSTSYDLPILKYGASGESTSHDLFVLKYGTSGDSTSYDLPKARIKTDLNQLEDLTYDLPKLELGISGDSTSHDLPTLNYGTSGASTSYELPEAKISSKLDHLEDLTYHLPTLELDISGNSTSYDLPVLKYGTSGNSTSYDLPKAKIKANLNQLEDLIYELPELKLGIPGEFASHKLPALEYGTSGNSTSYKLPQLKISSKFDHLPPLNYDLPALKLSNQNQSHSSPVIEKENKVTKENKLKISIDDLPKATLSQTELEDLRHAKELPNTNEKETKGLLGLLVAGLASLSFIKFRKDRE